VFINKLLSPDRQAPGRVHSYLVSAGDYGVTAGLATVLLHYAVVLKNA